MNGEPTLTSFVSFVIVRNGLSLGTFPPVLGASVLVHARNKSAPINAKAKSGLCFMKLLFERTQAEL
jgi:hypothetical protein